MPETETIDVGEEIEYEANAIEAIDLSCSDYELGDGIELSVLAADRQGKLKFEFEKMYGRVRDPFAIREDAWRCLAEHAREIDVWLLRCEHQMLQLSDDTTLATFANASGERYVRLRVKEKTRRAKTFELTCDAWTYLANAAQQITRDADAHRRY
jgi:hypothetical protein